MSDTNKQVELIRASFMKNLAAIHPLEEHPIDQCEEYVQKLYIDALTVISQYENPNAEDTNRFIQRIMAGAGLKEPFTEHLKNALEITPERYGEFLKQCTENKLTDIFLIDSIIIGCAGGEPNKKQVDFIAETSDMLSVNKRRFKWLVGLAKSILLQSNEEYKSASDAIPHDEKNEIIPQIVCYLKEFVCGVLVDTDDLYWVYSKAKAKFSPSDEIKGKRNVVVENAIIDDKISMSSCNEIKFSNCELCTVKLSGIGEAFFEHCQFDGSEYISGPLLFFPDSDSKTIVHISNCVLSNYRGYYLLDSGKRGIVLDVNNSRFENLSKDSNTIKCLICYGYDWNKNKKAFRNCEFLKCGPKDSLWNPNGIIEENNNFIS